MTDKEIIKEQAYIDISNLRIAQEQGIITEFGRGKMEALEGIVDFIDSLQEEPVSEDLEVEVDRWYNNEAPKEFEDVLYDDIEKCAKHFVDWQKQQDQSTIELAEDHAMLAGMEKMKEEMIAKVAEGKVISYEGISFPVSNEIHKLGLEEGDKVKVIILKDE